MGGKRLNLSSPSSGIPGRVGEGLDQVAPFERTPTLTLPRSTGEGIKQVRASCNSEFLDALWRNS
jgi:hypothetical protein